MIKITTSVLILFLLLFSSQLTAQHSALNLVPNPLFEEGQKGALPAHWTTEAPRPGLAPSFKKVVQKGKSALEIRGTGRNDITGSIKTEVPVEGGKTYLYKVRFRISKDVNPQRNLLFQCYGPRNKDGIFEFEKKEDGWIEGSAKILFPGTGEQKAVVRIIYRHNEKGTVYVDEVSLTETSPVPERWVRVGVSAGKTALSSLAAIAEKAAEEKVDIFLFPEFMNGGKMIEETFDGASCTAMSALAKKHRMYIAGGIVRKSENTDQVFNTTVLYDREGKLAGYYDKIHLYSPEVNESGLTPGDKIVVLKTDFGKVGFMTCYDSWFTDVAEMNGLKGAELVLFPNAGYYRSLMPARATDNNIRIMASSLHNGTGIWDTGGRDVLNADADRTSQMQRGSTFKDTREHVVDNIRILVSSLDLNFSPSPHYNDGTMYSAPGGRRNRSEQLHFLEEEIKKEKERWWKN